MSAVSLRYFVLDVFLSFLTEVHLSLKAFQMDPNAPRPEGNVITPAIGDQLHVSQKVSYVHLILIVLHTLAILNIEHCERKQF